MHFTHCKLPQLPKISLEDHEDDSKVIVHVGRHSGVFDRVPVTQIFENCGYMDADSDFTRAAILQQHTIGIVNALCWLEKGEQLFNPLAAYGKP